MRRLLRWASRRLPDGSARAGGGAPPLLLLLLVLSIFSANPAAAGAWPCAASRVHKKGYTGTVSIPTFAIVYDTTVTDGWSARLTFDRVQGRSTLSASSSGIFDVALRVAECLDVLGVPAGTPIDATLQFAVDGWATQNCGGSGCGVMLEATVVVAADSASATATQGGPGYGGVVPLVATLTVPIHFLAGTPVTAQFAFRYMTGPGAGGAQGEATGTWRVAGLPEGVVAVGSAGSNLTPARTTTWGRLKTLYR